MAIIKEVTDEGTVGFQKRLDPAAAQMLIDAQQTKQYKFPERSTIRELTANGIDAVYEKNTAIKILTGKISKDEVYKTRHDSAYADSNFFPGYFDLKYLDPKDEVTIRMVRGYEHDQLIIRDTGVGVGNVPHPVTGKSRLEGILEIGYSTKRNTDNELGSFGIGGKSALSMGVDSYMFTSRHNGKLNQFRVYNFHFNCLIGKLREGAVKDYLYPKSDSPHEIYYLEEEGYNYTEISVRTQRSQRQLLESAVLDQFQYFDNVHFYIVDEDGTERKVEIESNILYESESIVIPDPKSSQYTRPHLVLRGINYGLVEFENMELETKFGSIGYKITPSSVDVDRSRESLIWNEKTRNSVSSFINDIQPELEDILKESFDKLDKVDRILYSLGANKPEFSLIDLIKDLLPRENSKFMESLQNIRTNPIFSSIRGHEVKVRPQKLFRRFKSLKITSSFKDKYDNPTNLGYGSNEEIVYESLIRNRSKDPILFLDESSSVTAKQRVSAFLHFQNIEEVEGFGQFYIVYGKVDSKPIKLFKTLIEKMGIPYAFLSEVPEISDSLSINEEDIKSEAEQIAEMNRARAREHSKWKKENVAINYRVDDYIKGATPAEEINKNIEKSGADYAVWGVGTFVSSNPGKDDKTLSLAQRIYTHFKLSNPIFSKWGSDEHMFTTVEEYKEVFPEPGSVADRIYRQSDSSVNFFEISKSNERLFVDNIDKNLHVSNLLRGTTGLKNALDFRWCGKILTFFAYAEEYATYLRDFRYSPHEVVTLAGREYEFALINVLNNLIELMPGWSSVSSGWSSLPNPIYFEGKYLDETLEKYCDIFFEQYEDNKDEAILRLMDNLNFKVFGCRDALADKYALYLMKVARYARFLFENPDAPEDLVISLACSTFDILATEKNFDEKLIPRKILGLDVNFKENFDKVSEAFNMFPKFKGRRHTRLEIPGFTREESIDMLTELAKTGYFNN